MTYALGPVKPHVKTAAELIGPMFGISTVYGFGFRELPTSDHPKGLALDFMTKDRTTGDALANYVIQHASELGVKYVIWWGRIWNPREGWDTYHLANKHYDHVHVSFNDQAGTNFTQTGFTPSGVTDVFGKLDDALRYLATPGSWKRIGMFVVGFLLVLLAVSRLMRKGS